MAGGESVFALADVLRLPDDRFHPDNVIVVTGAAGGVGRVTAVAAAVNNLMTVGVDLDEAEGKRTQEMAREMGGQMIFLPADLSRDEECERVLREATKLGEVKYLIAAAAVDCVDGLGSGTIAEFDRRLRLSIRTPLYLTRLAVSYMRRSRDGGGVVGHLAEGLVVGRLLETLGRMETAVEEGRI